MQTTIRFLRANPYRKPIGSTDETMGYGVHDALVQRGVAEFVTARPLVAAGISEPRAESTEAPKRRQRRSETIEEIE